MPLNLDQYIGVHATALDVRARRTELIANNLANADTPGYQARDIDFRQAMARAAGDQEALCSAFTIGARDRKGKSDTSCFGCSAFRFRCCSGFTFCAAAPRWAAVHAD